MKAKLNFFTIIKENNNEFRIYENTYVNYFICILAILALAFCVLNQTIIAFIFFLIFLGLSLYKIWKFNQFIKNNKGDQSYRSEGSKYSFADPRCFIVEVKKI